MTADIDIDTAADTDLPPLRVRGLSDLVQAIPYLLGFHPVASLVLVGMAEGRVVVTARVDLADMCDSDALLTHTLGGLWRGGAHRFLGVVFDDRAAPGPDPVELPWAGLVTRLTDAITTIGCKLDDVVLVGGGRLWSYTCRIPECCPPEGRPLEPSSTVAAAATYAGMVALPDRASVAAVLDPLPSAERERLRPDIEVRERDTLVSLIGGALDREDRSSKRALFRAARAADVPGAAPDVPKDAAVRFAVALQRYCIRDPVWMAVDHGRLDGRVLWRRLAARLPAPYDAPALFLFGWATYRRRDGALAGIAAERALESDPGYSAADLLLAALSQAIDPRQLPRLRSRRAT